jgi:hypothetical protein
VPGRQRARFGIVAYLGTDVTAADMLVRWEREVGPVADRDHALVRLEAYVASIGELRIGNVVEVAYSDAGLPELRKLQDTPPSERRPPLPE